MLKTVGIWIRGNVEEVFLILTAIVAIVSLAFSHLGLVDFKQSDYFVITLLCLIAICLFLGAQDSKKSASMLDTKVTNLDQRFDKIHTDFDKRLDRICGDLGTQLSACHDLLVSEGGEFRYRRFDNATDFVNYLANRILQAKRSIDDLTWVVDPPAKPGAYGREQADKKYYGAILDASSRITYREIYIFCDDSKYDKIKELVNADPLHYHCRYYEASPIPRPVFMIIDNEEVLLYGPTFAGIYCSVRHALLVKSFAEYFEALWNGAIRLKDGRTLDKERYKQLMEGQSKKMPEGRN